MFGWKSRFEIEVAGVFSLRPTELYSARLGLRAFTLFFCLSGLRSSDSGPGSRWIRIPGRDLTRFHGGGCLARAVIITSGNTVAVDVDRPVLVPRPDRLHAPHPGTIVYTVQVGAGRTRRPRVLECTQYGFGCQQVLHLSGLNRRAARTRDTRTRDLPRAITDSTLTV